MIYQFENLYTFEYNMELLLFIFLNDYIALIALWWTGVSMP
jgi:hypothetical protein